MQDLLDGMEEEPGAQFSDCDRPRCQVMSAFIPDNSSRLQQVFKHEREDDMQVHCHVEDHYDMASHIPEVDYPEEQMLPSKQRRRRRKLQKQKGRRQIFQDDDTAFPYSEYASGQDGLGVEILFTRARPASKECVQVEERKSDRRMPQDEEYFHERSKFNETSRRYSEAPETQFESYQTLRPRNERTSTAHPHQKFRGTERRDDLGPARHPLSGFEHQVGGYPAPEFESGDERDTPPARKEVGGIICPEAANDSAIEKDRVMTCEIGIPLSPIVTKKAREELGPN
jgi:hypothetical protein